MNRNSRQGIDKFLACKNIAVAGFSLQKKKFGHNLFNELNGKGYNVYPVNRNGGEYLGKEIYTDISLVPEDTEAVVVVVNPEGVYDIVKKAADRGISNIWLQQGAENKEAENFCRENGINLVSGECVLMFAEPAVFIHKLHRGIKGLFGKLPT